MAPADEHGEKRILIVDDETGKRELMNKMAEAMAVQPPVQEMAVTPEEKQEELEREVRAWSARRYKNAARFRALRRSLETRRAVRNGPPLPCTQTFGELRRMRRKLRLAAAVTQGDGP